MKHNNALLHGCLLAAGLTLLPFAAHATGLSNHFLAENSFTQSVKDGYQDIKKEVKETVDELTGDDKTDTQKFQERRDKDLKEVRDAQKDYAKKREKAQREYLKHHKQLPFQEDLQKDLESAPAPTTAK
jgi:Skp family chaperone for outer membrane proteins